MAENSLTNQSAPEFAFDFKGSINNRPKAIPKSIKPITNANTSGPKLPPLASSNPYTATVPPWKAIENLPHTCPSSGFRVDLLTANLQYLNKTYESCQSAQKWALAHQCLLKMIKIMKRQSLNAASLTNAVRTGADTATFSDTLDELQIKLFSSHLRLEEYEEAWEMLPTLNFNNKGNAELWKTAYREHLTTAGCLDRAFKIDTETFRASLKERETRNGLFYQAEISCRKAIDAAIDGKVDIYGRPAKYELYAIMAIIDHANQDVDGAVFWKTLVVADEVDIEKDLASFPVLTRWIKKYNDVQDVTLQSIPLAATSKVGEVRRESDAKLGEKTDAQPEGSKVELLGGISELREELKWNLNEIKETLKQGLQDIKTERQEIEELEDEIRELKNEWEADIDILRDEIDELRDEFGDRLLEELQEGLDPELSVGVRLESVRIANGRIAEMNREVKEKLDELEAELTPSIPQDGSSASEELGLD